MSITDFGYDPQILNVNPGSTVRWINNGETTHTVETAEIDFGGGIIILSGDIEPGESWQMDFTEPGFDFTYRCAYHSTLF